MSVILDPFPAGAPTRYAHYAAPVPHMGSGIVTSGSGVVGGRSFLKKLKTGVRKATPVIDKVLTGAQLAATLSGQPEAVAALEVAKKGNNAARRAAGGNFITKAKKAANKGLKTARKVHTGVSKYAHLLGNEDVDNALASADMALGTVGYGRMGPKKIPGAALRKKLIAAARAGQL